MEKLRKVGQALKEKLDETAQNRVLERQRRQQEDEAAEKAIELEVRRERRECVRVGELSCLCVYVCVFD